MLFKQKHREKVMNKKNSKIKVLKKNIFDKLSFVHILLLWFLMIFIFGVLYYFLRNEENYIVWASKNEVITTFWDSLYYSFVAASNGFGDIIAHGFFRQMAVFEIILGIFIVALLISKIISIKQDIILEEIYEISFQERINRLRSALLLFRQNLGNIMGDIETNTFGKRKISDVEMHLVSFKVTLREIKTIILGKQKNTDFIKSVDSLNIEILFNSILSSIEKLNDLIDEFDKNKISWKNEETIKTINSIMSVVEEIFNGIKTNNLLKNIPMDDVTTHYNRIKEKIDSKLK